MLFRNADRRRDARISARFQVSFRSARDAAKAFNTFSVNFSAGGLCLKSQRPHSIGEVVSLSLTVDNESFDLTGSVQWVRNDVVGIRFIELQPNDRERLQKVARELMQKSSPDEPVKP